MALLVKIYCYFSVDYSKLVTEEFINKAILALSGNFKELNSTILNAQLKLLSSLISTLPPIESWLTMDKVLKFESLLLSYTKNIDLISCLGELYLNSPTLLSRSGSLFIQLVVTSVIPRELKIQWQLRLKEVIHHRRQSNLITRQVVSLNNTSSKEDTQQEDVTDSTKNANIIYSNSNIINTSSGELASSVLFDSQMLDTPDYYSNITSTSSRSEDLLNHTSSPSLCSDRIQKEATLLDPNSNIIAPFRTNNVVHEPFLEPRSTIPTEEDMLVDDEYSLVTELN